MVISEISDFCIRWKMVHTVHNTKLSALSIPPIFHDSVFELSETTSSVKNERWSLSKSISWLIKGMILWIFEMFFQKANTWHTEKYSWYRLLRRTAFSCEFITQTLTMTNCICKRDMSFPSNYRMCMTKQRLRK